MFRNNRYSLFNYNNTIKMDVNINVNAFQCTPPIFDSVVYTNARYIFDLSWSSEGDYYATLDPTTNMSLEMEIIEISNGQTVLTEVINPSVAFDMSLFSLDILEYYPGFGTKYSVTFKLVLTNNIGCDNTTSYTVPTGTYP